MRGLQAACWLAVVGLVLVPTGCADDAGSTSKGAATTVASSGPTDHSGHETTVAPSTSAAPTTVPVPTRIDIVAKEYEWSGVPDELPAGSYPMSFRNEGVQAHEISIFRNPDRIDLHELVALGPEKMKDYVEEVGMLIAGAGTSAQNEITLELTPGEYEVVCFIPDDRDTKPHFDHGMHRKLVVR
jgi:plastocyanin